MDLQERFEIHVFFSLRRKIVKTLYKPISAKMFGSSRTSYVQTKTLLFPRALSTRKHVRVLCLQKDPGNEGRNKFT